MQMTKHVSFDLDGTIIDSQLSVHAAVREALAEFDERLNPIPKNSENLDKLIENIGIFDEAQRKKIKDRFKWVYDSKYCLSTDIYPGILKLLKQLRSEGYILNLITNKRERPTKKIIEHFDLQNYFTNICSIDTFDTCSTKKQMLDKYFCEHIKNMYIGDLHQDYVAATSSGYLFYHVHWGYGSKSHEYHTCLNVDELYNSINLA